MCPLHEGRSLCVEPEALPPLSLMIALHVFCLSGFAAAAPPPSSRGFSVWAWCGLVRFGVRSRATWSTERGDLGDCGVVDAGGGRWFNPRHLSPYPQALGEIIWKPKRRVGKLMAQFFSRDPCPRVLGDTIWKPYLGEGEEIFWRRFVPRVPVSSAILFGNPRGGLESFCCLL